MVFDEDEAAMMGIVSEGSWLNLRGSLDAEVTGMTVFSVYTEQELTSTLWLMALMISVMLLKWMAFKLST